MLSLLIRSVLMVMSLIGFAPETFAADTYLADAELVVEAVKSEKLIQISATFTLPLTQCESYRFLTDYSIQKDLPGFIYSNPTRLSPTKVKIDREVEERVLFIPIHLSSTIEVTEVPYIGTDFVQIHGSAKSYKGSWRIEQGSNRTLFTYKGITDPGSMMPRFLIEHYIKKNLRSNFEALIDASQKRMGVAVEACVR